jgi:hypothetical protein
MMYVLVKSLMIKSNGQSASSADSFFEVDHFMERCLNFKREMDAVMAPYKEVTKDM